MIKIFLTAMAWIWAVFFPLWGGSMLLVTGSGAWYRQLAGWLFLSVGVSVALTCVFYYMP